MPVIYIDQTGPAQFKVTVRPKAPRRPADMRFEGYLGAREFAEGISLATHWRIEDRAADQEGRKVIGFIADELADRLATALSNPKPTAESTQDSIIVFPANRIQIVLHELARLQRDNDDMRSRLALIEAPAGRA